MARDLWSWVKFRPVIEENRRRFSGKDILTGFEYLGDELMKLKKVRDPGFEIPAEFTRYISKKVTFYLNSLILTST
ncbi:MAG: hypothetical protein ABSA11_15080 [Candidatus Bathyarchaeia archaeon]